MTQCIIGCPSGRPKASGSISMNVHKLGEPCPALPSNLSLTVWLFGFFLLEPCVLARKPAISCNETLRESCVAVFLSFPTTTITSGPYALKQNPREPHSRPCYRFIDIYSSTSQSSTDPNTKRIDETTWKPETLCLQVGCDDSELTAVAEAVPILHASTWTSFRG